MKSAGTPRMRWRKPVVAAMFAIASASMIGAAVPTAASAATIPTAQSSQFGPISHPLCRPGWNRDWWWCDRGHHGNRCDRHHGRGHGWGHWGLENSRNRDNGWGHDWHHRGGHDRHCWHRR